MPAWEKLDEKVLVGDTEGEPLPRSVNLPDGRVRVVGSVASKTAQLLARHCDINLTMNTYTMLGVMDTAAAGICSKPVGPMATRFSADRFVVIPCKKTVHKNPVHFVGKAKRNRYDIADLRTTDA